MQARLIKIMRLKTIISGWAQYPSYRESLYLVTSLEGWLEERLRVLLGPGMAPRLGCKDEEEEGKGAGIELSLT